MTRVVIRLSALLALASFSLAAAALAQPPDLSGTWKLDRGASDVSPDAPLAGLIGAGVPETLHVTQPANGTLVVESRVNESHARLYVPGETRSTPVFLGEAGTVTTASEWEGGALVSRGRRESPSAEEPTRITERFRLLVGGRLQVEIVTERTGTTSRSTGTYRRVHETEPCESWATPCKHSEP